LRHRYPGEVLRFRAAPTPEVQRQILTLRGL